MQDGWFIPSRARRTGRASSVPNERSPKKERERGKCCASHTHTRGGKEEGEIRRPHVNV